MKNSLKLILASAAVAAVLVACGSKGGSSASTPNSGANAACVYDESGVCIGGSSGYLGHKEWSGALDVVDIELYRQFLFKTGMCCDMSCREALPQFRLRLKLLDGYVPGSALFSIDVYASVAQQQGRSRNGDDDFYDTNYRKQKVASFPGRTGAPMPPQIKAAGNGLQLDYVTNSSNYFGDTAIPMQQQFGAVQMPLDQLMFQNFGNQFGNLFNNRFANGRACTPRDDGNQKLVQIVTQYLDAQRSTMQVQVVYLGHLMGQGKVYEVRRNSRAPYRDNSNTDLNYTQ